MTALTSLARPEILRLRPYRAAHYEAGLVRLNANETPWRPPGDTSRGGLNHYPEAHPLTLTQRLAEFYAVEPEQLLVTRGSSEAIDLLVRCFCRAGADDVVLCPPTFGMYEVYAQLQGAGIINIPLLPERGFDLDVEAIEAAWTERTKLAFVCSPNNPTGNRLATERITTLAETVAGRGIIVVDAAYVEFADADPTRELLDGCDNVVVLRTLSKALGLAGVRCGVALAAPAVIDLIGRILPPYCYPTPCQDAALACLAPENARELQQRVATLCVERDRVTSRLRDLDGVDKVWPSEANFVLARVGDPRRIVDAARHGGYLIRDLSSAPCTPNCLRITIGTVEQNDSLLQALEGGD